MIKDASAMSEIKAIPQWVGWKVFNRANKQGEIKRIKIPINPHNGKAAATNDPQTWSDINAAWVARNKYNLLGVGFVFDLACGIIGIDLDHCINERGKLESWADQVVECLDSYAEYSPSGTGLHIFTRGTIPHSFNNNKKKIEMYGEKRYFTVTGKRFNGINHINDNQVALTALHAVFDTNPRPVERKPTKPRFRCAGACVRPRSSRPE